nr:hypothetical protein [uncultured bacterium]
MKPPLERSGGGRKGVDTLGALLRCFLGPTRRTLQGVMDPLSRCGPLQPPPLTSHPPPLALKTAT